MSTEPDGTTTTEATPERDGAVAELEDKWRRALADMDNLRKRYARELHAERAAERDRVAAAFLPVLDNLELALAHAGADPVADGVRAVRDQAVQVLEQLGYPRLDEVGAPFDPLLHEVVRVVRLPAGGDRPEGLVEEVVRPGYGRVERLLRPAAVAVGRRE